MVTKKIFLNNYNKYSRKLYLYRYILYNYGKWQILVIVWITYHIGTLKTSLHFYTKWKLNNLDRTSFWLYLIINIEHAMKVVAIVLFDAAHNKYRAFPKSIKTMTLKGFLWSCSLHLFLFRFSWLVTFSFS